MRGVAPDQSSAQRNSPLPALPEKRDSCRSGILRVSVPYRPEDRRPRFPQPSNQRFRTARSEEHTSEPQSLMRTSYAVFCLKKKKHIKFKKKNTKEDTTFINEQLISDNRDTYSRHTSHVLET